MIRHAAGAEAMPTLPVIIEPRCDMFAMRVPCTSELGQTTRSTLLPPLPLLRLLLPLLLLLLVERRAPGAGASAQCECQLTSSSPSRPVYALPVQAR